MTTHYGIIGCGMMGQEHLRNIALLEDAFVKVICEPDPEMAARALQLAPRAVLAENIDTLLAHDQLDCLLIASPNFCHVDQLEAIAARVSLPILVEKPLFTDPADWRRVEAFKRDYSAPVWVAMEYRYMPPMQQFLSRAESATEGGSRCLRLSSIAIHFCRRSATGTGSTVIRVAPLLKNAVISLI